MEEGLNKFKKLFCLFENISLSFKFCGNNGAIYFSCSERRDSYNIKILTSIHPWAVLDSKCYGAVVWLQSSCWVIKQ